MWIVIASTKSQALRIVELGPSRPATAWKWGTVRSTMSSARAPAAIPRAVIQTPFSPPNSMAGMMRLKQVAASMTPAAKPSITFSTRRDTSLTASTGSAPTPVASPAAVLATMP